MHSHPNGRLTAGGSARVFAAIEADMKRRRCVPRPFGCWNAGTTAGDRVGTHRACGDCYLRADHGARRTACR